MNYRVDTHSDIPPSRQLVERVLDALVAEEIPSFDKLPSVRNMAAMALVNPNTVVKAYRKLEAMGVVEGKNGSGVYVTRKGPQIARKRRGRDTLLAFQKAVKEALEAGHRPGDLLSELGAILEGDGEMKKRSLVGNGSKR